MVAYITFLSEIAKALPKLNGSLPSLDTSLPSVDDLLKDSNLETVKQAQLLQKTYKSEQENLAAIPGTVGGAPEQNIGAYGAEVKDTIVWVEIFNYRTGMFQRLSNEECRFMYRTSIFRESENPWIITRLAFELTPHAKINLSYDGLKEELEKNNILEPTFMDVANAVTSVRQRKLPDYHEIPNVGSFYKNPIIDEKHHKKLARKYSDLISYPLENNHFRISAAWLLEKCGFKGHRMHECGFSEKHALVLVNYGNAKGKEIISLSKEAIRSVNQKFKIKLKIEPQIV
ncbi:MAG: UDP-N-acetylmuramate dehydrogenase [Alcanivoracaceae bacterium]|nr:UDP-N-acetylmuramate dehydrogenase [Alcanivoracaceae bacterium]